MADKYFKAREEFEWKRNPQWMGIPQDPGTNNKLYILFAVIENNDNRMGFRTTSGSVIDWGDGSSSTVPGTSLDNVYHQYDYATVSGPILQLEDGRNYKQVLIDVTVDNTNYGYYLCYAYYQSAATVGQRGGDNCLEVVSYLGDGSSTTGSEAVRLLLNQFRHSVLCEHISVKSPNNTNAIGMFWLCKNLKKIELPSNFFHSGLSQINYFARYASLFGHDFGDVTWGGTGTYQITPFAYSDSFKIGNLEVIGNTIFNNYFKHSNNYSVGNVTALTITSAVYAFGGTVNNGASSIGEINMPNLEDARFMFRRSHMPEIVMTDCSSITDFSNAFLDCDSLQRCVLNGLTVSVDVVECQMGTAAIDELFTSLGTANGTQTIDVSNNPGSATCDTSIATAKGWTVIT